MFSKIVPRWIILGTLALALFPSSVLAVDTIPEFNPLCWKEGSCDEARRQLNPQSKPGEGLVHESPCIGEWGKCLPSGITETEVAFGGQRRFLHLGDFIQYIYRYAIVIAGLLAVIMLVMAGAQWVTSGGNVEAITSAKKRIGGALMGLFLAYMSYFILNAINPALVQFRLPQVWLVRPSQLVPVFCSAAPPATVFAKAAGSDNQISTPTTSPDFTKPISLANPKQRDEFWCGKRFYLKDGDKNTCYGDVCKDGEMCLNGISAESAKPYGCYSGMLAGRITGTFGVGSLAAVQPGYQLQLLQLCNNGPVIRKGEIEYGKYGDSNQGGTYIFPPYSNINKDCEDEGGTAGFFLGVQVSDQTGGPTGRLVENAPGSTGKEDWFAVGQTASSSHDCSFNLGSFARQFNDDQYGPGCGEDGLQCACSWATSPWGAYNILTQGGRAHLISLSDLEKGYRCDINITRNAFVPTDNVPRSDLATSFSWQKVALGSVFVGEACVAGVITAVTAPACAVLGGVAFPVAHYLTTVTQFLFKFGDLSKCGYDPGSPNNAVQLNI